jgi:hypothetical protein
MTQEHPIKPPLELVDKWFDDAPQDIDDVGVSEYVATQAARWGADQELEACCQWLEQTCGRWELPAPLRAARRPNPPSLKQQALGALYAIATGADDTREFHQDLETIKQALESLPS